MKKIIAFLLCAGAVLSFTACAAQKLGNMEFTLNPGGESYRLSSYTNTAAQTVLAIPDEFQGKPVTAIGEMAIQNCDDLLSIEIGPNLTEIDKWGVFGCRHLKEFVVSADNPAFAALDGVLFSKDFTRLISYPNANTAQYDKGGALQKTVGYTVPQGVASIAHCAFYKCYALGAITLPQSLQVIEDRAFHGCEALAAVQLPEGLVRIGGDAFLKCLSLTEITIPSTVEQLGDYVFYSCDNLERVTILAPQDRLVQGKRWLPEPNRTAVDPIWG